MIRAVKKGLDRRVLAVLAGVAVFAACAGENLFTVPGVGSGSGPQVEITAPTEGATQTLGESLDVAATVAAQAGAVSAQFKGVYEVDGSSAYATESQDLNGLVNLSLNQTLGPAADQEAGLVVVIVSVTDQAGQTAADSVTVEITP